MGIAMVYASVVLCGSLIHLAIFSAILHDLNRGRREIRDRAKIDLGVSLASAAFFCAWMAHGYRMFFL